jgi:hypothetical protein
MKLVFVAILATITAVAVNAYAERKLKPVTCIEFTPVSATEAICRDTERHFVVRNPVTVFLTDANGDKVRVVVGWR